jgi:hypothetical protein
VLLLLRRADGLGLSGCAVIFRIGGIAKERLELTATALEMVVVLDPDGPRAVAPGLHRVTDA